MTQSIYRKQRIPDAGTNYFTNPFLAIWFAKLESIVDTIIRVTTLVSQIWLTPSRAIMYWMPNDCKSLFISNSQIWNFFFKWKSIPDSQLSIYCNSNHYREPTSALICIFANLHTRLLSLPDGQVQRSRNWFRNIQINVKHLVFSSACHILCALRYNF